MTIQANPKGSEVKSSVVAEGAEHKALPKMSQATLEYFYSYGHEMYNSGNYQRAAAIFQFLTVHNPGQSKYSLAFAASLHMQKKYADAFDYYSLSAEYSPNDPMPFYYMSDCAAQMKQPELVAYCLTMTVKLAGNRSEYALIKGRAELSLEGLKRR